MEDLKHMSIQELENLWIKRRDELFEIRKELDRRTGKGDKPVVNIDYDKYITK